jgi:endonuclease-3
MAALTPSVIETAIFPAGFYKRKARTIIHVCTVLRDEYDGQVPDDLQALVKIKGIGRKTANLVLSTGFGIDAICVDTHVHRICNRWNYVNTASPDATEMALRKKLPVRHWIRINALLVVFGQNICKPLSPFCSRCSLSQWFCPGTGVDRHR